jgi:hypothetical protein
MCIRHETWEKALQSLTFSPISKPRTHITYMLRQCTSIVYVLIDILRLQLFYYNTILFRSCDLTLFLFWEKKMLYHSIYNIYFAAIFVALSNSTFSNSSFNLKWQIRSLHPGQFWLENEILKGQASWNAGLSIVWSRKDFFQLFNCFQLFPSEFFFRKLQDTIWTSKKWRFWKGV